MSKEKELIKNTIILSLGNFLPQLTSLITLPILTAYISKADYGIYELINTIISLIIPIVTVKIASAAFRFMIEFRDNNEKLKQITTTILVGSIISSTVIVLLINFIFYSVSFQNRILIMLYIIFYIVLSDLLQFVRGKSFNKCFSMASIINSVGYMLSTITFIKSAQMGLTGILLSLIVGEIAASVYLVFVLGFNKIFSIKSFSMKLLMEMLQYSWPLVPNSLSLWVMNLSDRLIITHFLGLEQNAVYTVANKIPGLLGSAQGIFISAWQESASIAVTDKDSDEYYSHMLEAFVCVLTGILCCLIGSSPVLFDIIIRGNYSESQPQMTVLFGAMFFSAISSFLGGIYVAHKHTKSVGITTIVTAAINFLINMCFVRKIGLYAASISTLVSYIILTLYRMADIKKFQKINYYYKKYLFCVFIVGIMCYVYFIDKFYLNILNFVIGFSMAFILNRNLITAVVKSILKKLNL